MAEQTEDKQESQQSASDRHSEPIITEADLNTAISKKASELNLATPDSRSLSSVRARFVRRHIVLYIEVYLLLIITSALAYQVIRTKAYEQILIIVSIGLGISALLIWRLPRIQFNASRGRLEEKGLGSLDAKDRLVLEKDLV